MYNPVKLETHLKNQNCYSPTHDLYLLPVGQDYPGLPHIGNLTTMAAPVGIAVTIAPAT
ncbi:hypothetical protein SERLADRAFT_477012 [Serpula lacrymans var. lacrymans S7.9]|uniref:Uncharacterized protein n=1 Tax=Serpula lacrymans var. lacrymans (strain S7.9) TaxID=578457 RepID=F8P864_SERL9|nr:uncharacterized protein SERLADRAFT_477012 [Serpula lacrymans var. lacrymans S7.9]EGO20621.1 hypothetical protein SERLADRAFT_477012 [Serpula lacrymans var. lacrymans S7.9]